jgi:hypothetical protein
LQQFTVGKSLIESSGVAVAVGEIAVGVGDMGVAVAVGGTAVGVAGMGVNVSVGEATMLVTVSTTTVAVDLSAGGEDGVQAAKTRATVSISNRSNFLSIIESLSVYSTFLPPAPGRK